MQVKQNENGKCEITFPDGRTISFSPDQVTVTRELEPPDASGLTYASPYATSSSTSWTITTGTQTIVANPNGYNTAAVYYDEISPEAEPRKEAPIEETLRIGGFNFKKLF